MKAREHKRSTAEAESSSGLSVKAHRSMPPVSQPSDSLEQEAERVADQVVTQPQAESEDARERAAKELTKREQGSSTVSRNAAMHGSSAPTPPRVPATESSGFYSTASQGGEALGDAVRGNMQTRFGHDFGRVRVHTDADASHSAKRLNANAFTVGSNIVFGAGQYAPGTSKGDRLLAHELTHVLQQTGGGGVRGSAAMTFTHAPSTTPIAREQALADEIQDAAERSDKRDDEKQDPIVQQVGQLSSVGDAMSARAAVQTIDVATSSLNNEFAQADGATPAHNAQNATTQSHLEMLIDRSNVLDIKTDRFHQVYTRAIADWERLDAAVSAFTARHGTPDGLEVDDRGKLKWQGKQVADQAHAGAPDDKQASGSPERREAEAAMRDTKGVLDRLKSLSGQFDANVAGLAGASAEVRSDEGRIPNEERDNKETKAVLKEAAEFKSTVGTVLSMLKQVASRLPIGAAAVTALGQEGRGEELAEAGKTVYKADDIDKKIQDFKIPDFISLENLIFKKKKDLAAAIDATDMTKKNFAHALIALNKVEEQTAKLATTMADIKAVIRDLEVQTERIRKASKAAGEEYDKRHGTKGKGAAAGVLYGEASAFVATCQAASDQGVREKAEADGVKAKKGEIGDWQDPNKGGHASGMVDPSGMRYYYWTRDKGKRANKGYIGTGHIDATALKRMSVSDKDNAQGAAETTEKALADLKTKNEQAQAMRDTLGKMIGFF